MQSARSIYPIEAARLFSHGAGPSRYRTIFNRSAKSETVS
jgi:hypothetical protein